MKPGPASSEGERLLHNFLIQGNAGCQDFVARNMFVFQFKLRAFEICQCTSQAKQPLVSEKLCAALILL